MTLEAKMENPITLKLSSKEKVFISGEEKLSLETGVVFGDDHYGFNLIVESNGEEISMSYPTQCRIYGTQIMHGELNIFEDHKYIPWTFSKEGKLLKNAIFSGWKQDEWAYIVETYGVRTNEELTELNDYRKCMKK